MSADEVDYSARSSIIAGGLIMLIFFAGLGGWAAVAPLNSAVIAPAVVKVEGNRKSVQHLEGGIVREIRVRDGDKVHTGQVLLVVDDTEARGAVNLLTKQHAELLSQEARLRAEQGGAAEVSFPGALLDLRTDPEVARIMEAQSTLFASRRAALEGQTAIMRHKIAQAGEEIVGSEGRLVAQQQQLDSIRGELGELRDLFALGFVPRQRILELERGAAALEGQVIETRVNKVRLRQTIEELNLQIDQLRAERAAEVASELRDVQAQLLDVAPRLHVALETLERTSVTAPTSGTVVAMTAYTVGGIIAAGERVMEIVPDHGDLTIEATVNVEDQKDVHAGMSAEVHLIAYKQRTAPVVTGTVVHISADRLTDERTGASYYTAQIKIDREKAARTQDFPMIPGMPALVIIPTGERTALDFLLRPLSDSLTRSFREQ